MNIHIVCLTATLHGLFRIGTLITFGTTEGNVSFVLCGALGTSIPPVPAKRMVDSSHKYVQGYFPPNQQRGGVALPGFLFLFSFLFQQNTSGIGHRVFSLFG